MSIFGRQKEKEPARLEVASPDRSSGKKYQYDVRAALAEALLLFMLCYGAVSGFLSAYEMEYGRLVCALTMAAAALIIGFLYETKVKVFTNLGMIVFFLGYAYMAVSRFRLLNSGAYAVINRMYEVARSYLGVIGAGEYGLYIQNEYRTVTAIAIFVGVVGIILVAIRIQYSASFLRIFLMTFTLYLIPLYFDKRPDLLSSFFLLAGYLTLLMVQCSGSRKHISGQIRRALPVGITVSAAVVLLAGALIPQNRYRLLVPKNPEKAATEKSAATFAQYGMLAILQNSVAGGGVSGGKLSGSAALMPKYKTDLKVRFTPYSTDPVYLRAFAGIDYMGDSWLDVQSVFPEDYRITASGIGRKEWYESDSGRQGRGIMEVINVDASEEFDYRPYFTDDSETFQMGDTAVYTYYPAVSDLEIRGDAPNARYLQIPSSCYSAATAVCREAGFSGTPEEIAGQVVQYFNENFSYTLRPGYRFGNQDYITYFLRRSKKGYCSHFASAGVMLFRCMGIPARYVEGYAFSFSDMALDGTLLEEPYEKYYSGFAPLGETALVEVEVSDSQAHAWVEIYIEGKGWVVVDPTPAATEEEDVGSFWEIFGLGGVVGGGNDFEGNGLTGYLENALADSTGYLLMAFAAVMLVFLGKKAVRRNRERKLLPRERVKLEYRRLTQKIAARDPEFAALTTPAQELRWIRDMYGIGLTEEWIQRIYTVFFAPDACQEFEEIRRELVRIREKVRRPRKRMNSETQSRQDTGKGQETGPDQG